MKKADKVINKADKGSTLFIQNAEKQIQKAERQLSNEEYYEQPLKTTQNTNKNIKNSVIESFNKQK